MKVGTRGMVTVGGIVLAWAGSTAGLGLLAVDTTLAAEKQLRNVHGHLALPGAAAMSGYAIWSSDIGAMLFRLGASRVLANGVAQWSNWPMITRVSGRTP